MENIEKEIYNEMFNRKRLMKDNSDVIKTFGYSPKYSMYIKYPENGCKYKNRVSPSINGNKIFFEEMDTISASIKYKANYVDFLIFASSVHYGGGAWIGSKAQEEDVFLCTDLGLCHDEIMGKCYPLKGCLSVNCHIIRDANFNVLDTPLDAKAYFLAAPDLNKNIDLDPEPCVRLETFERTTAEGSTGNYLVIGAWGCGVFKNDPVKIAREFKKIIGWQQQYYKGIVIAIPDKRFLEIFKNELLS